MTPEEAMLQGIGEVADAPWIQSELTPSGELAVGGYALGVADVVIGLVNGANVNPNDLAASATSMVANLVMDLVGGLFSAVSAAVPAVGAIFDGVIGILSALGEAERAEERARQEQLERECRAENLLWKQLGTGPNASILPADYFVRATRDYTGQWTIERDAFVGQFLRVVLETSWPRWFVEGYDRRASTREWMRLMGADVIPDSEATPSSPLFRTELARRAYMGLHQSEIGPNDRISQADTFNWPPDCAEKRIARKICDGVAGQHPAVLALQGRPLGEAGREVWPLFCDLLYMLCRIPRPPWWADGVAWTEQEAAIFGLRPVPTLQEEVVRSLYSQPIDSARMDDPNGIWLEWNRIASTDLPYLAPRANPIGSCRGLGTVGCNTLYGLADSWRYFALPTTASDAAAREQQIREAWIWMWQHTGGFSKFASKLHAEMRATLPPDRQPMPRERARRAIQAASSILGWSPQATSEAAAILEAEERVTAERVKATTTAVALGVGATGAALGLAYLFRP